MWYNTIQDYYYLYMKNKLVVLGVCLGIFALVIVGQIVLIQLKKEGTLEVNSSPEASVFFDNNMIGKSPLSKSKIKSGEYMVKLVPENVSTTTASWSGKVTINTGKITSIDRELGADENSSSGVVVMIEKIKDAAKNTGQIFVESDPNGAIVYLDSEEKGISPLTLDDISLGDHEIAVFTPGFFRRSQKVTLEKTGDRIVASFKLAVDPTYKKVEADTSGDNESTPSATKSKDTKTEVKPGNVVIKDTPTGWLRVRKDASLTGEELAKVNSGDSFKKLESKTGWVKIEYEAGKTGWVSAQYVQEATTTTKPATKATPTPAKKQSPTPTKAKPSATPEP